MLMLHGTKFIDIHESILKCCQKLEILQKKLEILQKKLEILQKKFQQVRITRTKNGLDEALFLTFSDTFVG